MKKILVTGGMGYIGSHTVIQLFEAGYADAQANLYKDRFYQIRFEKLYKIDKAFPRIKESELRDGVGNVTYSIVLAMCDDYLVPENQVITDIQGL